MIEGEQRVTQAQPGISLFLAAFALLLVGHVAIVVIGTSPLLEGGVHGPDSYMRLVRVRQLYETGAWYDISIHRSNAPFGEELHWTRPADLVFLAGAWLLSPALGLDRALHWWSVFVSPLLHVATTLVLVWAVAPIMDRERRFFLVLTFTFQVGIWTQAMAARTDHHMLILLVFAAALGFTFRLLCSDGRRRGAVLAGVAAGFGLWLSVEFLVILAAIFGTLVVGWLRNGSDQVRRNLWHAIGLSAMLAVALLLERPAENFISEEYDRISFVHLFMGLLVTAFWVSICALERGSLAVRLPGGRMTVAAIGGLIAFAVMLAIFPKFFAGPEVDYDPRLRPIFLDVIAETRDLIPDSWRDLRWFLLFLGSAVFAAPYLVIRFLSDGWRKAELAWVLIGLALLLYLLLALAMLRFSPYAEVLMAIVLADLLARLIAWARAARLANRLAVFGLAVPVLVLGPLVGGSLLTQGPAATGNGAFCNSSALIAELTRTDRLGSVPLTVLTKFTQGPEVLYRTPHSVIGTPYPRNARGQLDSYRIYSATDPEEARRLVAERGIDIIVVCRASEIYVGLGSEPDMLETRLRNGAPPGWLGPVALSEEAAAEYRVYRVIGSGG
jgi:hypothetical protein